jgi:hypothetical protein
MGLDRKRAGLKDKNALAAVLEYIHDMVMQGWLAFRPAIEKGRPR